jgi:hypothetical protein
MRQRWSDLSVTTRTPSLHLLQQKEGRSWKPVSIKPRRLPFHCLRKGWCLSTRHRKGYEAPHISDVNQTTVQLEKKSTSRAIIGLEKGLAISSQRVNGGTLVTVGAQDWVNQIAVERLGCSSILC